MVERYFFIFGILLSSLINQSFKKVLLDIIEEIKLGKASRKQQEIEKIRRQKRKRSKRAKEKVLADKSKKSDKKVTRKMLVFPLRDGDI